MESNQKRCHKVKMTREAMVLKVLRKNNNLSMNEAGYRIGKSDSYISHLENGRMDIPNEDQLSHLLKIYGISFSDFRNLVQTYEHKISAEERIETLIKKLDKKKINLLINIIENKLLPIN